MKKIFTLALAMLAGVSATMSAQTMPTEPIYRLKAMVDYGYAMSYDYEWNEQNQLVKLSTELNNQPMYYVYYYDEAGNNDKTEMYRDMNGLDDFELKQVYNYVWNDKNQLVKRNALSYVSFSDEPLKTLPMVWIYNDKGLMVQCITYRDQECTDIGQNIEYVYDENDRLVQESDMTYDLEAKELKPSYLYTYSYDAEGRLVDIARGSYNASGVFSGVERHTGYIYDEDGDLIETFISTANIESKQSQSKYTYNKDISADQIVYPWLVEDDFVLKTGRLGMSNHMVVEIDDYSRADNGDMVLLFEWTYDYEDVEGNGIETVTDNSAAELAVSINGGMMTFGGADVKSAAVYTLDGRLVMSAPALLGGALPVDGLADGVYVVSTPVGSAKFVK